MQGLTNPLFGCPEKIQKKKKKKMLGKQTVFYKGKGDKLQHFPAEVHVFHRASRLNFILPYPVIINCLYRYFKRLVKEEYLMIFFLTLRTPRKPASENVFMSSAEYSCKLFKPIFAYRQTVWTQIEEQSNLVPHCLQK